MSKLDPSLIKDANARAISVLKTQFPATFPKNMCARTLTIMLRELGIIDLGTPIFSWAQSLATLLETTGWSKIDSSDPRFNAPQIGWVGVCLDLNDNGATDHICMSIGPDPDPDRELETGRFICADNHGVYSRNIGPGARTPIDYWLELHHE